MAMLKTEQPLKFEMYDENDYTNIAMAVQQVVNKKNDKKYIPNPDDPNFITEVLEQLQKNTISTSKDLRINIMKHFHIEYFNLNNMEETVRKAIKICIKDICGLLEKESEKLYQVQYNETEQQNSNDNVYEDFTTSESQQIDDWAEQYGKGIVYSHFYNNKGSFSHLMKNFQKMIKTSQEYDNNENNSQSNDTTEDDIMGKYWDNIDTLNKQYPDIKFSQNNHQLNIMSYYLYCTTELNTNPKTVYDEIQQRVNNSEHINNHNNEFNNETNYNQRLLNENNTCYNDNSYFENYMKRDEIIAKNMQDYEDMLVASQVLDNDYYETIQPEENVDVNGNYQLLNDEF